MNIPNIFLIIFTITYFIAVPINITFMDIPYGKYAVGEYLVFIVLWLMPLYFLYKKWALSYKIILILILINMIASSTVIYFWQIYAVNRNKESIKRVQQLIKDWYMVPKKNSN